MRSSALPFPASHRPARLLPPAGRHALLAAACAALPWLAVAAPARASLAAASPDPASAADAARSDRYREGQRAIADERWQDAAAAFTALAAEQGEESDAALYWKAYAESRLGRKADALASLRQLRSAHADSEWADDGRALELELRGSASGAADPRAAADDELKLYALDGLLQVEPERAVPILERFLAGEHSLELKRRALFVLSQSESPRARQILVETARRGSPPELRTEAVRSLGIAGEAEDLAALSALWREGATPEVKRAVLEAWLIADAAGPVAEAARSDADPQVRAKAVEMLGAMDATEELARLWESERDGALRAKLLEAYAVAGDVDTLARVARSESDPQLRGKAIEGLAIAGGDDAGRVLLELYGAARDAQTKSKVIDALMIHGDARALVELFRKETDPALKRTIVQRLSMIDDDEAEALLVELLEGKP